MLETIIKLAGSDLDLLLSHEFNSMKVLKRTRLTERTIKPKRFIGLFGNSYWVTMLISIDYHGIHKYGLALWMGQSKLTIISMLSAQWVTLIKDIISV